MNEAWYLFQEQIKEHFVSLGADAETNVRVNGVRTHHDIDIFVRTKYLGENITWLIEAKHWKSKVTKAQVLTLRAIVDDVGADRGILVSLKGFQKGALDAARDTNVTLKTFDELKLHTKEVVEGEILKAYKERLGNLEDRYWSHSKRTRIKYGLRHEVMDFSTNFVGQELLTTARCAILSAENRKYPIDLQMYFTERKGDAYAHNFQQLTNWLNKNLNHFDARLLAAEWEMYTNGDYQPQIGRTPQGEKHITEFMAGAVKGFRDNNG